MLVGWRLGFVPWGFQECVDMLFGVGFTCTTLITLSNSCLCMGECVFFSLRIGNDDLPTDSLPMFGISFFIFTVSHLRRYFIFSAHSQWEFLFQIISIKMMKKKISGWMCGRWNIKINITTVSFYILLSWFYMNMCSRMCLHLQVASNDSPGRGKQNIRRKSDPVNMQSHLCLKWKLFFYLATVAADKYFNMHWNLLRIVEQLFFDLSLLKKISARCTTWTKLSVWTM